MTVVPEGARPRPRRAGPISAIVRRSPVRRVMLLVLVLSLLPLILLALWQGFSRMEQERDFVRLRLVDRAEILASSALNPLLVSEGLLAVLSDDEDMPMIGTSACATELTIAMREFRDITGAALVDPSAAKSCLAGSIPRQARLAEIAGSPGAGRIAVTPAPVEWGLKRGTLLVSKALAGGGAIILVLDPAWLGDMVARSELGTEQVASLVAEDGTVLASSRPVDWAGFDRQELSDNSVGRHQNNQPNNQPNRGKWLHGAAPLVSRSDTGQQYWLVISRPEAVGSESASPYGLLVLASPVLALLAGSLAIWLATDRVILRWIRQIGIAADGIGRGDARIDSTAFDPAPIELRSLALQLQRMGGAIAERDRTLRRQAEQQRLSALELNHRMRNNLQVIGSWLALERRETADGAGSEALDRMAARIAAVSLVHRLLYDVASLSINGPTTLLNALCPLLQRHGIGNPLACDLDDVRDPLGLDAAMPIALWVVETGMVLQGAGGARAMTLRLRDRGDAVHVSVQDDDGGVEPNAVPPLLAAIGWQLSATVGPLPGGYVLQVPRTALAGLHIFSAK